MARVKIGNVRTPIDYLKQFFAPAGYGLGGLAKNVSGESLNNCVHGGYYAWQKATDAPFDWGYMHVTPAYLGEGLVQTAYCMIKELQGCVAQRTLHGWSTWSEWEWINPPMTAGVEYRTTERWNGKAVYTTLIDFDFTVEGTTSRMLPFGGQPIRYSASANGVVSPYHPGSGDGNNFEVYVDGIEITLTVGSAAVGKKVYVQLWYWK